jgi:hypothetical protein
MIIHVHPFIPFKIIGSYDKAIEWPKPRVAGRGFGRWGTDRVRREPNVGSRQCVLVLGAVRFAAHMVPREPAGRVSQIRRSRKRVKDSTVLSVGFILIYSRII